jgi:hypothetical protein
MGKSNKDKSSKNPLIDTPSSLKLDREQLKDAMDVDPIIQEKPIPSNSSEMELFKARFNSTPASDREKLLKEFGFVVEKGDPTARIPKFLRELNYNKPVPDLTQLTAAIEGDQKQLEAFVYALEDKFSTSAEFLGLNSDDSTEDFRKRYESEPALLEAFDAGNKFIKSAIHSDHRIQYRGHDGRSFYRTIYTKAYVSDATHQVRVLADIREVLRNILTYDPHQVSISAVIHYVYNALFSIGGNEVHNYVAATDIQQTMISTDTLFHMDIRLKHNEVSSKIDKLAVKSTLAIDYFKIVFNPYLEAEQILLVNRLLKLSNFTWRPNEIPEADPPAAYHTDTRPPLFTKPRRTNAEAIVLYKRYSNKAPSHVIRPGEGKLKNSKWCLLHSLERGELTDRGWCNHTTAECRSIDPVKGKTGKKDRNRGSPYGKPEEGKKKEKLSVTALLSKILEKIEPSAATQPSIDDSSAESKIGSGAAFGALAHRMELLNTDDKSIDEDSEDELLDVPTLKCRIEENPDAFQGKIDDQSYPAFFHGSAHLTGTVDTVPFAAHVKNGQRRIMALLDTGATDSMVNLPESYFDNYVPLNPSAPGITGVSNSSPLRAFGRGTVWLPTSVDEITIHDCLRVPGMIEGILLVSLGTLDGVCQFKMERSKITCYHKGKPVFVAKLQRNRLYVIETSKAGDIDFVPKEGKSYSLFSLTNYFQSLPNKRPDHRASSLVAYFSEINFNRLKFCPCNNSLSINPLSCNHQYTPEIELKDLLPEYHAYIGNTQNYPLKRGTLEEWHLRSNHRSDRVLFQLASIPNSGIKLTTKKRPPCAICREANAKTPSHKQLIRITRGIRPGEYYHIDIHFNSALKSFSGYIMWLLITDDFSRTRFSIFLKKRKDFHADFRVFLLWSEAQTGIFVKRMQMDGDRVFLAESEEFLLSRGTQINTSMADQQWQNGVSEAGGYQITKDYRAALHVSGLPYEFWDEACRYSIHVSNLIPNSNSMEPWHSPYTAFTGLVPDYSSLIAFGASVHYYLPKDKRPSTGKHELRGRNGIYLGPAIGFKGYRIAVPTEKGASVPYTIVQTVALTHCDEEPIKLRSRPDYLNKFIAERITASSPNEETDPPPCPALQPVGNIVPNPAQNIGLSLPTQQQELKHPPLLTQTADDPEVRRKRHTPILDITESFNPVPTHVPVVRYEHRPLNTRPPAITPESQMPSKKRIKRVRFADEEPPRTIQPTNETNNALPLETSSSVEGGVEPSHSQPTIEVIPSKGNIEGPARRSARIQNRQTMEPKAHLSLIDPDSTTREDADRYFSFYSAPKDEDKSQVIPIHIMEQTLSAFYSKQQPSSNSNNHPSTDRNSPHFIPTGHNAFTEAMNCAAAKEWEEAIYRECSSIIGNDTFEGTDELPPNVKAIGSKWVFTIKYNDGEIALYKARLTARGDMQKEETDTWSPTVSLSAVKIILSWAASQKYHIRQFDISTAFLNGTLDTTESVYMKTPPGMSKYTKFKYLHLLKALYGLKQAGRRWTLLFRQTLTKLGLVQSEVEECIFYQDTSSGRIVLFFWVDDIIVASPIDSDITHLMQNVLQIFKGKSLGVIQLFLGITYKYVQETGSLTMNLSTYITTQIETLEKELGFQIRRRHLPMRPDFLSNIPAYLQSPAIEMREYARIQGILTYIAQYRIDIAPSVNILAKYSHQPTEAFADTQYHILGYLSHTRDMEMHLGTQISQPLTVFCDSDHAGRILEPARIEDGKPIGINSESRRSRSGAIWFYRGGCIAYLTKQQALPTDSSTYAELVAAHDQLRVTLYLRKLVVELEQLPCPLPPTPVFMDNLACIRILTSERITLKNSKHFETRFMFTKHYLGTEIHIHHVRTDLNLADFLTKPLGIVKFWFLLNLILCAAFCNEEILACTIKSSDPEVLDHPPLTKKEKSKPTKSKSKQVIFKSVSKSS